MNDNEITLILNRPGKRFDEAQAIQAGASNPIAISRALVKAIEEVKGQGTDAIKADPAVRLIVHQLAFLCNVRGLDDISDYDRTVTACGDGAEEFSNQLRAERTYHYHINLDERGTFAADVRDHEGKTVYEIRIEGGDDNDSTIFTDGFMDHKNDIQGLRSYLQSLEILPANAHLVKGD